MIELSRFCYSEQGTFGRIDGLPFECVTVEQPWRGNRPFESCIPEGIYNLVAVDSPRFGPTFALENASVRVFASATAATEPGDRFACLIHGANRADQLQGCIAPGRELGVSAGKWAVLDSQATLKKLLAFVRDNGVSEILVTQYRPEYP